MSGLGHKKKSPYESRRKRAQPLRDAAEPHYAHLVEEEVHPFQALCGAEEVWQNAGPEPPVCPECLAIYEGLDDAKEIVR